MNALTLVPEAETKLSPLEELMGGMIDMDAMPHCVLVGTPIQGFSVYGPFINYSSAEVYAETNTDDGEFWITPCHPPTGITL